MHLIECVARQHTAVCGRRPASSSHLSRNSSSLVKKGKLQHRVVFAVTRPEPRAAVHGTGRNQGIAQLDAVALAVVTKVVTGPASYGSVNRHADERRKDSYALLSDTRRRR